jgi:hypothetical protein
MLSLPISDAGTAAHYGLTGLFGIGVDANLWGTAQQ